MKSITVARTSQNVIDNCYISAGTYFIKNQQEELYKSYFDGFILETIGAGAINKEIYLYKCRIIDLNHRFYKSNKILKMVKILSPGRLGIRELYWRGNPWHAKMNYIAMVTADMSLFSIPNYKAVILNCDTGEKNIINTSKSIFAFRMWSKSGKLLYRDGVSWYVYDAYAKTNALVGEIHKYSYNCFITDECVIYYDKINNSIMEKHISSDISRIILRVEDEYKDNITSVYTLCDELNNCMYFGLNYWLKDMYPKAKLWYSVNYGGQQLS